VTPLHVVFPGSAANGTAIQALATFVEAFAPGAALSLYAIPARPSLPAPAVMLQRSSTVATLSSMASAMEDPLSFVASAAVMATFQIITLAALASIVNGISSAAPVMVLWAASLQDQSTVVVQSNPPYKARARVMSSFSANGALVQTKMAFPFAPSSAA
jgi:hypothetical protein